MIFLGTSQSLADVICISLSLENDATNCRVSSNLFSFIPDMRWTVAGLHACRINLSRHMTRHRVAYAFCTHRTDCRPTCATVFHSAWLGIYRQIYLADLFGSEDFGQ